jgi:PiT family inorganic phosphate transporter
MNGKRNKNSALKVFMSASEKVRDCTYFPLVEQVFMCLNFLRMEIAILIVVLGLVFDYTNGFHDAANVVSTVIATKVMAPLSAIVMAAILNFLGATQISGVAQTIASGLVEMESATQLVVLCAVVAAIIWNLGTWYYGIPSSSSYALIGGLIGAAWAHKSAGSVLWHGVLGKVVVPMVASPIIGFVLALSIMRVLLFFCRRVPILAEKKIFRHLQVGSACFVALSHGLNDAQKSMGLITLGLVASGYLLSATIPLWVILSCAIVMGLGTATGGFRIIRTMAFSITRIDSMQGFAAEASASAVILVASFLGMPVSSTHVIAGGITGVGAAKGRVHVRWSVPQRLVVAWIVTLPGAAALGALGYWMGSVF